MVTLYFIPLASHHQCEELGRGLFIKLEQEYSRDKASSQTSPETCQLPSQSKASSKGNWQRHNVVREKIGISSHRLMADSTQETVGDSCCGIENLHHGADKDDLGRNLDDFVIFCEDARDLPAEYDEDRHVEQSHGTCGEDSLGQVSVHYVRHRLMQVLRAKLSTYHFRCLACSIAQACPDEISDSG